MNDKMLAPVSRVGLKKVIRIRENVSHPTNVNAYDTHVRHSPMELT
jgi:hypothetical protein